MLFAAAYVVRITVLLCRPHYACALFHLLSDGFLNMKSSEDHLQFLKKKWYCLPIWGPNLTNMPSFESQCKSKTEAHPESLASSLMVSTSQTHALCIWLMSICLFPTRVCFCSFPGHDCCRSTIFLGLVGVRPWLLYGS